MPKRKTAVDLRIADLVTQIAAFDDMAEEGSERDLAARVGARKNAAMLRKDLASIRAEREAARERDPIRRLEMLQARAVQDGSWVAAAQLGKQIEMARQQRAADEARAEEERRRSPEAVMVAMVERIRTVPELMAERIVGEILKALAPTVRRRILAPYLRGVTLETRRTTA